MEWLEIFTYCNGILYWRIKPSNNVNKGDIAGKRDNHGYIRIKYKRKYYYRHRIIYEMFNGPIENDKIIRHINDMPGDDRIENLIIGTSKDNAEDRIRNKKMQKNNVSKCTGVNYFKKVNKWGAFAYVNGKTVYLGYFDNWFDAVCIRKSWENKNVKAIK